MRGKFSIALLITLLPALIAGTTGANPSQVGAALNRAPRVTYTYSAGVSAGQPITPVGSGFTYQGRLLDGGNPANGSFDLRFTLFDALTGGNQVGSPLTHSNQTVTNGLFTVTLDFGTTAFRGDARFMQIEVQHNGGGFVILAPRQPLTPAPYAISLMPGAVISATTTSNVLTTLNNGDGVALKGIGSGGSGVEGYSTSWSGVAGYTSSSTKGALDGTNFGSGPGVSANSTSGAGMNATGHTAGVYGLGTDVSAAGVWGVANSGTGAAGLYGTSSSGYGAQGISTAANGTGVYGIANSGTGASGLYGTSTSGYGAQGISSAASGAGVQGQTTVSGGTGVRADGNGSATTALAINNGAIKVTGAGDGTQTAVFVQTVHTGTGGNTCQSDFVTILDNPYTNGDPSAILLVTPSYPDSNGIFPHSVTAQYRLAASSGCPANRWALITTTSEAFANGEKYNVMVIKP